MRKNFSRSKYFVLFCSAVVVSCLTGAIFIAVSANHTALAQPAGCVAVPSGGAGRIVGGGSINWGNSSCFSNWGTGVCTSAVVTCPGAKKIITGAYLSGQIEVAICISTS